MSFKNKSASKPYCKVCHDAGKPESEYTSHHVRSLPDKYGKTTVTCPTLNSTECRYCYKLGHTAKFCPVIERNKKMERKVSYPAKKVVKQEVAVEKKNFGVFSALADDSDEEPDQRPTAEPKEDFPALSVVQKPFVTPAVSWSSIAEKPAAVVYKHVAPTPEPVYRPIITKSWADWTDSDEDEDELEYETTYNSTTPIAADDDDW